MTGQRRSKRIKTTAGTRGCGRGGNAASGRGVASEPGKLLDLLSVHKVLQLYKRLPLAKAAAVLCRCGPGRWHQRWQLRHAARLTAAAHLQLHAVAGVVQVAAHRALAHRPQRMLHGLYPSTAYAVQDHTPPCL